MLEPLRDTCSETDVLALVGAPTCHADGRFIAALAVPRDDVIVAYRKTWLGGDEAGRFAKGDGPTVITVDGWRLGLAICKDTGSAQHTAGTAALDVDAYLAGVVHRPDELAEQEARATVISRACCAYTVIAAAAGTVGEDYPATYGASAIRAPNGLAVARAGTQPDDIARATLDKWVSSSRLRRHQSSASRLSSSVSTGARGRDTPGRGPSAPAPRPLRRGALVEPSA